MRQCLVIILLLTSVTTFSQTKKNEIKNRGFIDLSGKLNPQSIRKIDLDIDTVFSLSSVKNSRNLIVDTKQNKISNTKSLSIFNDYGSSSPKESSTVLSDEDNRVLDIYKEGTLKTRIIAINRLNPNKIIAYFKLLNIGVNDILMAQSSDNEKSWQSPTIAIKHNKIRLEGWGVLNNYYKRNRELFMLLTDTNNRTYLSKSIDKGHTWNYPFGFSNEVIGTDFEISVYKDIVYLLFRSTEDTKNYQKGDILLWFCNIKEFVKENSDGVTILIKKMDNLSHVFNWSIYALSESQVVVFKQQRDSNTNLLYLFSLYHDKKTVDFIY